MGRARLCVILAAGSATDAQLSVVRSPVHQRRAASARPPDGKEGRRRDAEHVGISIRPAADLAAAGHRPAAGAAACASPRGHRSTPRPVPPYGETAPPGRLGSDRGVRALLAQGQTLRPARDRQMSESSRPTPRWPGPSSSRCLVTGASGYIGGRLVPELLAAGYPVRCMARDPGKLSDRSWSGTVEVAAADALDKTGVRRALEGVDVAYYLIHSLGTGASFEQRDRDAAGIFAEAAVSAGVRRIVYLGGIVPGDGSGLSPHLRSRAEVGDILLGGGVPVAALQAAVIIGSGSASFEMLRYLTERLPVMVTPKWVETRIQPIAVRDVLRYLVGCAALPPDISRRFDIGGPDVLTYAEMMRRYSRVAGLRPRVLVPVPLLTPRLSSLWVGLVTPVPAGLARPLVESLRNEVVCSEHDIASHVPDPPEGPVPLDRAIALALRHTREGAVSTRWSSAATPGAPSDPLPSDPSWAGGSLYVDGRMSVVRA